MEFICNDVNGPSQWFYDRDANAYLRRSMAGEDMGTLQAQYLTDPATIIKKQPQASTLALWQHQQGVLSANSDSQL